MNVHRGKIVSGGRIQVPADIRKTLGLADGDSVILEVVGDELHVRSYLADIRRIQELLKPYRPKPGEPLISDQLIADRRKEAENE
jgi:AbrB family looped-hinge helix DNA binding protein